ncbi:translation initiation factor III [Actinoplanes sp. NPDC049668]|uniref:translation initiation factor III n=1 Tax=unclassified Actinoplanes TaxID=2626549 RepID=UPI0033B8DD43
MDVPIDATGGRTPPSKIAYAVLGVSIIAAIWAAAMLTSAGKTGYVYFFSYCLYYMGVVCLVSLSITIMLGLVATDRLVLSIRQRVLLQSAHRTTGIIAVSALFVHVWTKVAMNLVGVVDVFIPFLLPYNGFFIGLGSVSAYVMVLVMWTGLARARFIGKGKPWMWRGIHAISYLMWPLALLHGLNAGRPAATWVIVSYVVCVLGVLVGLAVRLSVSLNRRKDFASQAGTGAGKIQPVGKLVPTTAPSKGRGKSRRDDAVAPAAVEPWTPAAPVPSEPVAAPAGPPPQSERRPRRGVDDDERARRRRDYVDAPTQRWEFEEDDMPAQRSRRYAEDEAPAPRQRRAPEPERFDEPTRAISRRAAGDVPRAYAEDDDVPAPRGRRRAEDDYAEERPPARSRRYAGTEFEQEPAPEPRGRRYADEDEVPAPRGRRFADAEDAPAPRQRRYPDDERYEEAPRRRSDRYVDDEPPRPSRASRYADDAETAPRARRDRGAQIDSADPEYDEAPALVDMASRRARRATQQEPARTASRGARRGGKGGDESADDQYFRQLRGEAQ